MPTLFNRPLRKMIPQNVRDSIRHFWGFSTSSFYRCHLRWLRDKGDDLLRLQYKLNPASVVVDIGGFEGNWADAISAKFGCKIYVFEPVSGFYNGMQRRFASRPNIKVLPYGLSGLDEELSLSVDQDASGMFRKSDQKEIVHIRDITHVLTELGIGNIDLMKINIEGAEFPLLTRLIETGDIKKIANLQVQFHLFVPDARVLYKELAAKLRSTHRLTWSYPFVWENWERIDSKQ